MYETDISSTSIGRSQLVRAARKQVAGTQSVRRALQVLRLVAKHRDDGVKLVDVVRESELDRGTAYRLLSCLVEEQFVDRDDEGLYYLGPEAVLLGSLSPRPTALLSRFIPVLRRVARISGDTVFLMMRQGDSIFCLHREEGNAQVRVLTTNIGQRRMLGTGTAGVAVFELMSDGEIQLIYERQKQAYALEGFTLERLLRMASDARQLGYAEVHEAFDEVGTVGLGVAFRIGHHGMGAISLGTLAARLNTDRRQALIELMREELRGLGLRS